MNIGPFLQKNRIPVAEAVDRTSNWRRFLKKLLGEDDSSKLVRGIYISAEDIEALSAICKGDKNFQGVRAYFALLTDKEKWPYVNTVKIVMVPVKKEEGNPNGKDVCILPNIDNLDDSNIYDFTMPCPDCCDTTSMLYSSDLDKE